MSIIVASFYAVWLLLVTIYTIAIVTLLSTPIRASMKTDIQYIPKVSLVIPTYNEARIIEQKLENVLQLEYPMERLEVLVVDSGSTDSTRETVRRFANTNPQKVRITLIEEPIRRGKSAAINQALRSSDSEIFALTDADVMLRPDGLLRLIGHLRDDKVGAASGVEIPVGRRSLLFDVEAGYKTIYAATRMSEASMDTPFMCESEFSVFKRNAVTSLSPGCMCDDLELTIGVRAHGLRCAYVSDAPFFENEAAVLRPKLRHKYRRGMANQHGISRNWRIVFNKAFGKYGATIFPFEFFVHIISPVMLVMAIVLFGASIFVAPNDVAVEILVGAFAGLLPLGLLWGLTQRYDGQKILNVQGRFSWLLGAGAFMAFQPVLVASLVHLAIKGPKLEWAQISETRLPVNTEIRVAPST